MDPFCGSGTLLVESLVSGRNSLGVDIDPLATFISEVKSNPIPSSRLEELSERMEVRLASLEREPVVYDNFMFDDLTPGNFETEVSTLEVPRIPNLFHWFRRYVIVDLAHVLHVIRTTRCTATERRFFELVFASIIRASSNADPVPVSGLEVTSHMKERDAAGRRINPFELYRKASKRAIRDMGSLCENASDASVSVSRQDASRMRITKHVDAVITSPPYHGAVDYYRRHQLEMFWLGLTKSQDDRLRLLRDYLGRPKPPASHPFIKDRSITQPRALEVEHRIRQVDPYRANAFKHYCVGMTRVFSRLATFLEPGTPAVFVVGHSSWNGGILDTSELFAELSAPAFAVVEELWYPIRNRYMSYSRHNDASIDREYVLVLRRSDDEKDNR